jgi:hypothetical protein
LECQTPSLPTTAPSSPAENSWSSATTTISAWIGRPSHTHRPMARWNVPMA